MPKTSLSQRKTIGRVMHEFEHDELKSGPEGKGGKVRRRRQAIAIALNEAGASKFESDRKNRKSLARTKKKEAAGETGQQEKEGRSHVGAQGRRESTPAMGGSNATKLTASGRKAARTRSRRSGKATGAELYERAKKRHVEGRSRMTKQQLENALRQ